MFAPRHIMDWKHLSIKYIINANMTSFFRFVNKRAIYRLGIMSLAHAPVHVTDFPVVRHIRHTLRHIRIEINHGSQNVF